MKKNPVTLIAGGCLILLFGLLLFCFQVRQGEVAVVTTFGRPTRTYEPGGPYFKWPTPIQKDHHFDQRIQNYEGKFEETLTSDAYPLLMMTYLGWRINDPAQFFPRFDATGAMLPLYKQVWDLAASPRSSEFSSIPSRAPRAPG